MATYAQLQAEPVWRAQFVPPNMDALLIRPLRAFYGLGPASIGAPGDNNHLRGRHRSYNWCLDSAYCTDRSYGTRDARDRAGDGNWYRAFDTGITGQTLYDASRRMDALVRSGRDGGRVAEWFGTFDGRTVKGWYQGAPSTSDTSHLWHLHVGVWTRYADDADLMRLLFDTITGATPQQEEDDVIYLVTILVSGTSPQVTLTGLTDGAGSWHHIAKQEALDWIKSSAAPRDLGAMWDWQAADRLGIDLGAPAPVVDPAALAAAVVAEILPKLPAGTLSREDVESAAEAAVRRAFSGGLAPTT